MDDLVARFDAPSISCLKIVFTNQPFFVVDFTHLSQFIGRVKEFRSFGHAWFDLSHDTIRITLIPQRSTPESFSGALQWNFLCDTDRPIPTLVEACNTSLLPLSDIESYSISAAPYINLDPQSGFNMEDLPWLKVLRQFSAAKSLSVSTHIVPPVAFALKQVMKEEITDVLPAIQELSVSMGLRAGPDREAIERFAAARGLSVFETSNYSSKWRISARNTHEG